MPVGHNSKEHKMNLQKGSRVLVNIAPFIGSGQRTKDSIPCRVLSIKEFSIEVATEDPYRELSMWVSPSWIEGLIDLDLCHPQEEKHEPLYV
jgi:hypothetical protein